MSWQNIFVFPQGKGKAKEVTTLDQQNNDNVKVNKLLTDEEVNEFLKLMK